MELRGLSAFNEVKDLVEAEAVAIVEEEVGLLRTLAEWTSAPLQELLPLKSVNNTKRMDFASSATRRGTVSSNAGSYR
jgi:hypothetical protein